MQCSRCEFLFFNPRMEPAEEGRLYADYRSPDYQQMRQGVEPWYTPHFNSNLTNPGFMEARRKRLVTQLTPFVKGRNCLRILDFGGDRGGLVKNLFPDAEAFVYDISAVAPECGVTALRTLDDCRGVRFDVILSCHVLEHVGAPRMVLEQIRSVASQGTLVFVEVPFESPLTPKMMLRRAAQIAVLLATRPAVGFSLAKSRGLCLMHEHVNYFETASLRALMDSIDWKVIAADHYRQGGPAGGDTVGWSLAAVGGTSLD